MWAVQRQNTSDTSIALKHRKIFMQCVANYWWSDCRKRDNHGMLGGTSLAKVHAETGCIAAAAAAAAAFDESSAFTSVLTPPWMWGWRSAPPIVASKVWSRLPLQLTSRISPAPLVFPQYMRLVMGSSHSVHLLMNVNITIIGRTLLDPYRTKSPEADKIQIADFFPRKSWRISSSSQSQNLWQGALILPTIVGQLCAMQPALLLARCLWRSSVTRSVQCGVGRSDPLLC